ncbi:alpha/beta fold hydrolase [Caulobacter henricii]|uniref:alpha/beta fold hydrolase n=1 Tax=Caulobacter henricii TaxID=69395 RepID=UPI000A03F236|nr:alpha/beta hydrolase [Caulobacter henricii]
MFQAAKIITAALVLATSLGAVAQAAPVPARPACQPINEESFVRIGGIEQWVTIKGSCRDNPVVLVLHGGPGNPISPFADALYGPWEKDVTLVQWDQRGAGKTFGRNPDNAPLTIEGMAQDGIEVATYLTAHLGQKKVVLVVGSWSSVLGVHMAKARPELFQAYIGTGQLVRNPDNQIASYQKVMALARAAGDTATVTTLEALGPPPWINPRAFGTLRRATRVYEAKTAKPAPKAWWAPAAPYATDAAQADYEAGEEFSFIQFVGMKGDGMLSHVDLPALGPAFAIPMHFVQGSEDLVTTPEVARAYYDSITAPRKTWRLVTDAGHDPNESLLAAQHDILMTQVLPQTR